MLPNGNRTKKTESVRKMGEKARRQGGSSEENGACSLDFTTRRE
jgi:hypothetical protein